MNIQRMKRLVEVLQTVQRQKLEDSFSLHTWFGDDTSYYEDELDTANRLMPTIKEMEQADKDGTTLIHIPHKCGTTACAVGYAGLDAEFRKEGLKTNYDGSIEYTRPIPESNDYEILGGWWGVVSFFGFECTDDAKYYFLPDEYDDPTIENVIARIQEGIDKAEQGAQQ